VKPSNSNRPRKLNTVANRKSSSVKSVSSKSNSKESLKSNGSRENGPNVTVRRLRLRQDVKQLPHKLPRRRLQLCILSKIRTKRSLKSTKEESKKAKAQSKLLRK
jgi:hypothetical protein